jgi:hypothetical protein
MRPPTLVPCALRLICASVLLTLCFTVNPLKGQTASAVPAASDNKGPSFADALKNRKHPLHILYVHGIGDDGLDDYDSYYLRRGICETLHCPKNERDGKLESDFIFANSAEFKPHATPPYLSFLGQVVFPVDSSGGSELWDASTPFLRRFKLAAGISPVYVDELNWWPLVFALKCRYMVAPDAALVGADKTTLGHCAREKQAYSNTGHFSSYPFISPEEAARLEQIPKRGALINRSLKGSLLDWGFTDAILSLGPMRKILLDGLGQLIQLAVQTPAAESPDATSPEEFIIVTHSLGSYLIFAALDTSNPADPDSATSYTYLLAHTSRVYFFANQLRLLEMANLDVAKDSNLARHLNGWVNTRTAYLSSIGEKAGQNPPQIVAWNDASDLLTWEVPPICGVVVENHTVQNTFNWFGLVEGPTKAHDYYGLNPKVIHGVLNSSSHNEPPPCPTAPATTSATPSP